MTADQLVERLKSRGCEPMTQHGCHEVRDAVHEAVHFIQARSKSWEREALHEALCRAAERETIAATRGVTPALLRFELQARAVEMLVCEHFGIKYDIDHWAFITWLETAKSLSVDIGSIDRVKDSIKIVSRQYETKRLLERVLAFRGTRKPRRAT